MQEIEELRARLIESEAMVEVVKRHATRTPSRASAISPMTVSMNTPMGMTNSSLDYSMSEASDILALAKKDLKKEKSAVKKARHRKRSTR